MDIKDRLIEFISYKKLTNSGFEKIVGLSNGYICNFKGNMGREKLERIFKEFPELNREWLVSGKGMMMKSSNNSNKIEIVKAIQQYYKIDTQNDFANFLGISVATLTDWMVNNTYNLEILINKCTEINPRWMANGEGDMLMIDYARKLIDAHAHRNIPPMHHRPHAPVIGINTGKIIPIDLNQLDEPIAEYIHNTNLSDCDIDIITGKFMFAYRLQTTMLEPVLFQGDWILLNNTNVKNVATGHVYLIDTKTYGKMIKRVERVGDDEFICSLPINKSDYPAISLKSSDVYDFYEVVSRINANSIPEIFANYADRADMSKITEKIIDNHSVELQNHQKTLDLIDKTISMINK